LPEKAVPGNPVGVRSPIPLGEEVGTGPNANRRNEKDNLGTGRKKIFSIIIIIIIIIII
jgi:hypothetical protein